MNENRETQAPGIRGRMGEWCYRSGMLRLLQHARRCIRHDLRILAYHRVLTVPDPRAFHFDMELVSTSAGQFRQQMMLLKRRFHPVSLGDVLTAIEEGKPLPVDAVAVTFDDGYDDNYRVAYPILRELGIPATFFVSTGHIESGMPYVYDWLVHMVVCTSASRVRIPLLAIDLPMPETRRARRHLAADILNRLKFMDNTEQMAIVEHLENEWQMPRRPGIPDCRPMTWDQLRRMQADGFEIGSHGVHHRMLAKLPRHELDAELAESAKALQRELGKPATLISYPVGGERAFDEQVVEATAASGYRLACSYICGTNSDPAETRFTLKRLPVERQMGPGWFEAMLTLPALMSYPSPSYTTESGQAANPLLSGRAPESRKASSCSR